MNTALLVKRRLGNKVLDQINIRSNVNSLVLIAVIKDNILAKILLFPTKEIFKICSKYSKMFSPFAKALRKTK